MSVLRTSGLGIAVGERRLVHELALEARPGELWCVLGKNGAGKTTLLHTLAGLRRPDAGRIEINGENIAGLPPADLARLRGLMTQHQSDAFSQTVLDTVLVGRAPYRTGRGWDSEPDLTAARTALTAVGLAHLEQADVLRLSGGERQRVALAALLAQEPSVLLLDEPSAHQDAGQQLAVFRLLKRLSQDRVVIVNCHDINAAASFATHALLLAGERHWAGEASRILVPDLLEQVFACAFETVESAQGRHFLAR